MRGNHIVLDRGARPAYAATRRRSARGVPVRLPRIGSLVRPLAALLAIPGLLSLAACENPPNTEAEGGYIEFREALLAQDPDGVWGSMCEETHVMFSDSLASLNAMNGMIDRLRPSDRADARGRTGAALLGRIGTPQDLFRYVFYLERVPTEVAYREGLEVDAVEPVDEFHATVRTDGGQAFELLLGEDGIWRVKSPVHEVFASALQKIQENRANLELAVTLFGSESDDDAELEAQFGIGPLAHRPSAGSGEGTQPQ